MNRPRRARVGKLSDAADAGASHAPAARSTSTFLLLLAAIGIPLSLLWDVSWENTVGIDRFWSLPHTANFLAIALAACAALGLIVLTTRAGGAGVRLWRWEGPIGAWVVLWGAFAFVAAVLLDRWWQAGYGLVAGIWHPPQLLKAAAFFAVIIGVWLCCIRDQDRTAGALAFAVAGGVVLAMINLVTPVAHFPNTQRNISFYQAACATYPLVLVALATAGRRRFSATLGALGYTLLMGAMVWLLPLIPGEPQVAPIYHPRDHLLPAPFPLLLVLPALALDALIRLFPGRTRHFNPWGTAVEAGLAFFLIFTAAQWLFAGFLLTPAADHWFFAGGGKQWPPAAPIQPPEMTVFWKMPGQEFGVAGALIALGLAVLAARGGLWLGAWMKAVRR